jgi:hypothetical protein
VNRPAKTPRVRYQPLIPTGTILLDAAGRLWRVTGHRGVYATIKCYEPTGEEGPAREDRLQAMTVVANPTTKTKVQS